VIIHITLEYFRGYRTQESKKTITRIEEILRDTEYMPYIINGWLTARNKEERRARVMLPNIIREKANSIIIAEAYINPFSNTIAV
jgi:hypothetical protein